MRFIIGATQNRLGDLLFFTESSLFLLSDFTIIISIGIVSAMNAAGYYKMLHIMSSPALEISNLSKVYANGTVALQSVDLRVEAEAFFGLLGSNGAGKSTTIGIVTSLVNKTAGKVRVFGVDMDEYPSRVKSFMGLVPQEFNFHQFEPVFDVVVNQAGFYGVPYKEASARTEEYLTKLGLWEKRAVSTRQLSGGMKRRLMIARALVHHPRLLILDEPTASVDIEVRRMLWSFLAELNRQGTTIILTTHYLEEAERLCRDIAIIDDGRIIEHSPMRQLLEKLDIESFTLYLQEPLQAAPMLKSAKAQLVDEKTLEIAVDHHADISTVFAELDHLGIRLLSLRNKTNRLEELFIKLTEN